MAMAKFPAISIVIYHFYHPIFSHPAPGAQSSVEPLRRVVLHAHVQQRRHGAVFGRAEEKRLAQQVLRQAPAAVLGVHRDAQQVEPGRSGWRWSLAKAIGKWRF